MPDPNWPFIQLGTFGPGAQIGPYRTDAEIKIPVQFPGNLPTAGLMGNAQRLKFIKGRMAAGNEEVLTGDVDLDVFWGQIHEQSPENIMSGDVSLGIAWGRVIDESPENIMSGEVRLAVEWNRRLTESPENTMSGEVRLAIQWVEPISQGFSNGNSAPEVYFRDTYAAVEVGDYTWTWRPIPPAHWIGGTAQVTAVQSKGSAIYYEVDSAAWRVLYFDLTTYNDTISGYNDGEGFQATGGDFPTEEQAQAFYDSL